MSASLRAAREQVCAEVLGIERVGMQDNFFDVVRGRRRTLCSPRPAVYQLPTDSTDRTRIFSWR